MQGTYISISEFEQYKANEAASALSVLDINLRNENLLNQSAARMLGFSSYEALQPMHERETLIKTKIVFDRSCPFQANRPVLRHANCLAVLDFENARILGRVLNDGDERECLDPQFDGVERVEFPSDLHLSMADITSSASYNGADGFRYDMKFTSKAQPHLRLLVNAAATHEGLFVAAYLEDTQTDELEDLGTLQLAYTDCLEENARETVNQAALKYLDGPKCFDHTYYQWMIEANRDGELRYLSYGDDWQEEGPAPTSFLFPSKARAIEFREESEFNLGPEDFEGLVLVRKTTAPVSDKH